jgi:hypothetical protein
MTPQQGTAISTAGVIGGFVLKAIPFLQAISLVVGIAAAVMTCIYTYKRLRAKKYD